jgi:uncharacterized phage-associated protein
MPPRAMNHDSRAVANYFLRRADAVGKAVTPMQVIKLTYFAHGWNLGIYELPLINDEVEAWDYGPVIRPVYDAFKRFGNQPITELATERHYLDGGLSDHPIETKFNADEVALMNKVWDVYGHLKGFQLSQITHRNDSPWHSVYNEHGRNSVIPDTVIAEYFKKLGEQNRARKARLDAATA